MRNKIKEFGIIPVVVLEDAKQALPLAHALYMGGLPCVEITYRTKAASKAIKIMKKAYPDMYIGAGTVLTKEQVDEAIISGVDFIVTPGFDIDIVRYCQKRHIPIIPGAITPSEVAQVIKAGLTLAKFFPASAAGGISMIQALSAPYPMLEFMPTGGINLDTIKEYLSFNKVVACGGSWMVPLSLIKEENYHEIQRLVEEAVSVVKEIQQSEG